MLPIGRPKLEVRGRDSSVHFVRASLLRHGVSRVERGERGFGGANGSYIVARLTMQKIFFPFPRSKLHVTSSLEAEVPSDLSYHCPFINSQLWRHTPWRYRVSSPPGRGAHCVPARYTTLQRPLGVGRRFRSWRLVHDASVFLQWSEFHNLIAPVLGARVIQMQKLHHFLFLLKKLGDKALFYITVTLSSDTLMIL